MVRRVDAVTSWGPCVVVGGDELRFPFVARDPNFGLNSNFPADCLPEFTSFAVPALLSSWLAGR